MLDGRWRAKAERALDPIGRSLHRLGISANGLTILGLVIAAATAVAIGSGHLTLAFFGVVLTGVPDLLDGSVARYSGKAGPRGAFFDSVADRVSDALMLGGVAWYLVARHHGMMALLPFAIMAMTQLISYQRAKAELLGLTAKGGLMERAERFILLGLCFVAGAVSAAAFVPALWVFFGLIAATAAGRFVRVWQEAEGPVRPADAAEERTPGAMARWREGRVDSRWRTWRDTRLHRDAAAGAVTRHRRTSEPLTRWRARRETVPATRVGRTWRTRRPARTRLRNGRHAGPSGY